jgi:hypothetical protein
MPKVEGGPKGLNSLLERVYSDCMRRHNNEQRCSTAAWTAAKSAGWYKDKDGKWKKKTTAKKSLDGKGFKPEGIL